MIVHIVLLGSICLAFISHKKKQLLPVSFGIIGAFSVLRYNFGNDYSSYMRWYNHIQNGGESPFKNEVAFSLLNEITPSFFILIAATSLLWLWIVFDLIKKNSDGIYSSIAFAIFLINPYLFLMNLSAIRQCTALCIFIIALRYARAQVFWKYGILIIIAALFHTSAILLLPIYFFANTKKIERRTIIIIAVIVLLLLFGKSIVENLLSVGLGIISNTDYNHYFGEGMSNSIRATVLTGIYFVYLLINIEHLEGDLLVSGKLYLLGLIFGILAIHYSMFTRLQMYFDIFSIITLPAIVKYHISASEKKWIRVVNLYVFPIILLLIYLLRYGSFFINPMWRSFINYHTIFEVLL